MVNETPPRPLPHARRHLELRVGYDNVAKVTVDGLVYLQVQMEAGSELLFADIRHVMIAREIK